MHAEIVTADPLTLYIGITISIGDALFLSALSAQTKLIGWAELISDARVISRGNKEVVFT